MNKNSRLVYSTATGRVKPSREKAQASPPADGIVRIRRETRGRKGKGVTTVAGVPLQAAELKALATELKKLCGTGGAVKNDTIEIQGDHREKIRVLLESRGYNVKFAGG